MDVTLLYNGYNLQRRQMFTLSRTILLIQRGITSKARWKSTGLIPYNTNNSPHSLG